MTGEGVVTEHASDGRRVVHVAFGTSSTGALRRAGADAGRDVDVVCLFDDLSTGPLTPDEARARWLVDEYGSAYLDVREEQARVWATITSPGVHPVVWMSRRNPLERCGFLEVVRRRAGLSLAVVDVADLTFLEAGQIEPVTAAFGGIPSSWIVEHAMFDYATEPDDTARDRYRALWERLREENASLRVIDGETLRSAAITHYDTMIVEHVTAAWSRCATVVGAILACQPVPMQVDINVIWPRLLALIDEDVLEGKNDDGEDALWDMSTSWVRRPASSPPDDHRR